MSSRDDPHALDHYRENSLELIELSSINEVSLIYRFPRDWTSREYSLGLIKRSSIHKVSLV